MKHIIITLMLLATGLTAGFAQTDTLGTAQHKEATAGKRYDARFFVRAGASLALSYGTATLLKTVVDEERPDNSDYNSFPSRHTSVMFAAATVVSKEWGHNRPWVTIVSYGAATAVGVQRIVSDRHYTHDVLAGAALGFASAQLSYYLTKLIFK